jgi:hypothetical protein
MAWEGTSVIIRYDIQSYPVKLDIWFVTGEDLDISEARLDILFHFMFPQ